MPVVNIERVISASSEDPAFPAENLLKSDNTKKWKCKVGEKQASVILQLNQDTVIDGIDVGNEHSAFIEVLVGKSSSQSSDYKVLLIASSLMTLKDAKDGMNTNGVRFFKNNHLTKPTADEKWDRVKIVCTQPFNKHVQYGLSFLVLHSSSPQDSDIESRSTLGKFALKEEEKDQPVTVGSWFAKRKDPPPPIPPGAAAAIRDASLPAGIAQAKKKKPTLKRPRITIPTSPKTDDEDSPADDTDADSTYSPNKNSSSVLSDDDEISVESDKEEAGREKKRPKRDKKDNFQRKVNNGKVLNNATKILEIDNKKTQTTKVARNKKPFGRLLEGVTVVISGYQNPLRGELRSKACAMGAKYKADWDSFCTHLICAFMNTPKFNQVRGRGKIIKKEWIEECHNRRRRLPWRRFALDRNDAGTSSEDEIWEEEPIPTTSNASRTIASGVNRRRVSSGSDTEEEIERVRARQSANLAKPDKEPRTQVPKKVDPYTEDTDVDSGSESDMTKLPLPPLPGFFNNIVFHIASDIDDDERKKLKRYITAYKGCVMDDVDGSVEYAISRLPDIATQLTEELGVSVVSPDWVWECSDAEKLISSTNFIL